MKLKINGLTVEGGVSDILELLGQEKRVGRPVGSGTLGSTKEVFPYKRRKERLSKLKVGGWVTDAERDNAMQELETLANMQGVEKAARAIGSTKEFVVGRLKYKRQAKMHRGLYEAIMGSNMV